MPECVVLSFIVPLRGLVVAFMRLPASSLPFTFILPSFSTLVLTVMPSTVVLFLSPPSLVVVVGVVWAEAAVVSRKLKASVVAERRVFFMG